MENDYAHRSAIHAVSRIHLHGKCDEGAGDVGVGEGETSVLGDFLKVGGEAVEHGVRLYCIRYANLMAYPLRQPGHNTVFVLANRIDPAGLTASVETSETGQQYMQVQIALDSGGVLRVDDPFAATGTITLEFAEGMAPHHELTWKEAA